VLEIPPAKGKKGRFTRMLPRQAKSGKGKVKAKGKERKVATATGANPCATIEARGMGTAAMPLPATSRMMVLKKVPKEKGKEQHRYRRKPLRKQRKKSWQW
jgi:hypothetical protein